jgi:hypothetical protein
MPPSKLAEVGRIGGKIPTYATDSQPDIHSKHQWQVVDKFCQYSIELAFIEQPKNSTQLQSTSYLAKGEYPAAKL